MLARELLDLADRFLGEARATARERRLARLRAELEEALARAFLAQGDAVIRQMDEIKALWPTEPNQPTFTGWERYFDDAVTATAPKFVKPLEKAVGQSLLMGALDLGRELMIQGAFNLTNPAAARYIREHGAELVAHVTDTTKQYIRTLIAHGMDEGWSYDKIAQAMIDRYEEFAVGKPQQHIDSRAHGIAVTEMGNAYEQGSRIMVEDLAAMGLVMEKSWLTVGDDRVCSDECERNEAQGWIPAAEPFASGHQQPLSHPYCRCTALYRRQPGVAR